MAGNKASSQLDAIYQTVGNSEDEHIYAHTSNVPKGNYTNKDYQVFKNWSRQRKAILIAAAILILVCVVLSSISLYRTEIKSDFQTSTGMPEQISTLGPEVTTNITTLTTQPISTSTQLPSCRSGYYLNPFSNTCFGASGVRNWTEAKRYCEDKGEFLATPHSLESASWLQQMHINKGLNSCTIYMYCISMHTHIQILGAQLYDFDPHWLISNIFVAHFHF